MGIHKRQARRGLIAGSDIGKMVAKWADTAGLTSMAGLWGTGMRLAETLLQETL